MGIQLGSGAALNSGIQTSLARDIKEHTRLISTGTDNRNAANNIVASLLNRFKSDGLGYINAMRTATSYLSIAKATLTNVKNELTEMKQMAIQAQSGAAADLTKLNAVFTAKQRNIYNILTDANYAGSDLFQNTTQNEVFRIGKNNSLNATIDATAGVALRSDGALSGYGVTGTDNTDSFDASYTSASDTRKITTIEILGSATLTTANVTGTSAVVSGFIKPRTDGTNHMDVVITPSAGSVVILRNTTTVSGEITAQSYEITTNAISILNGTTADAGFKWTGSTFAGIANGTTVSIGSGTFTSVNDNAGAALANSTTVNVTGATAANTIGAIGNIDASGVLTRNATIDNTNNAKVASYVLEGAIDQIDKVLNSIDAKLSAISNTRKTAEESIAAAADTIEEMLRTDASDSIDALARAGLGISAANSLMQVTRNNERQMIQNLSQL